MRRSWWWRTTSWCATMWWRNCGLGYRTLDCGERRPRRSPIVEGGPAFDLLFTDVIMPGS